MFGLFFKSYTNRLDNQIPEKFHLPTMSCPTFWNIGIHFLNILLLFLDGNITQKRSIYSILCLFSDENICSSPSCIYTYLRPIDKYSDLQSLLVMGPGQGPARGPLRGPAQGPAQGPAYLRIKNKTEPHKYSNSLNSI